jgi:hypothetical protein
LCKGSAKRLTLSLSQQRQADLQAAAAGGGGRRRRQEEAAGGGGRRSTANQQKNAQECTLHFKKTVFNMASVGVSSSQAPDISARAPRARSKNLLNSAIQKAGLSLSCIMSPSSASSEALLEAALQQGLQLSCKKKSGSSLAKGMTSDDILALPPSECSICICPIEANCAPSEACTGCPALKLGCGHYFHPECIKPWLLKSASCPTCRWQCKKMRHPRAKAAAVACNDGWEDEPLQVGDRVWIRDINVEGYISSLRVSEVVVLNLATRDCYSCPLECVHLLPNEADEAACAGF